MKKKEVNELLIRYKNGTCSPEEKKQIRQALKNIYLTQPCRPVN